MREVKPSATIKPQAQTSVPTNADATIMDDTVVIMDDTTALMGGPTVSYPATKSRIDNIAPKAKITLKR